MSKSKIQSKEGSNYVKEIWYHYKKIKKIYYGSRATKCLNANLVGKDLNQW